MSSDLVSFDLTEAQRFVEASQTDFDRIEELGLRFMQCSEVGGGDDWRVRLSDYLSAVEDYDKIVDAVRDALEQNYDLNGFALFSVGNGIVATVRTRSGAIDWNRLSADDRQLLIQYRPDLILDAVNVPEEQLRVADQRWKEITAENAPVAGDYASVRVDANIAWFAISAEASEELVEYADGSVRLTLELSGQLGAAYKSSHGEVGAGVEAGIEVEYEFATRAEAEVFRAELHRRILDLDAGGVVEHLGSRSPSSSVVYGGIYVEADLEFDANEIELQGSVGIGHDLVTSEDIVYASFDLEVEFEIAGSETEINAEFDAQYRFNDDGPTRVTLSGDFSGETDALDKYFKVPDGASLRGGAWGELEVNLEDPQGRAAWEAFQQNGDFGALWAQASVTFGTSVAVASEEFEIEAGVVEVEAEAGVTVYGPTFTKEPGGSVKLFTSASDSIGQGA